MVYVVVVCEIAGGMKRCLYFVGGCWWCYNWSLVAAAVAVVSEDAGDVNVNALS